MFYKELLYVIISLFCLQDETYAEGQRSIDPRLTIINVYSGLETIDGGKINKPEENEVKQITEPEDDKNITLDDEQNTINEEEDVAKRVKQEGWKNALICDWKKMNPPNNDKIVELDPDYVVNCEEKLRKPTKDKHRSKSQYVKKTKKHSRSKKLKNKLPFMYRGFNSWRKISNPYQTEDEDDVQDVDPDVVVDGDHAHQNPDTERFFTRLRYFYQPQKRALQPRIRFIRRPRGIRFQTRRKLAYEE